MNTLNYFVQHYKQGRREIDSSADELYLQRAVDCLKKLRALKMMDNAVKWVPLHVQTSPEGEKWAYYPSDYRSYNWVGCCHNGKFVNFDLNNDLCMIAPWDKCACDGEAQQTIVTGCCNGANGNGNIGAAWWGSLFGSAEPWSYSYSVGSYAVGPGDGGRAGTFRMDDANQIIRFDKCVE